MAFNPYRSPKAENQSEVKEVPALLASLFVALLTATISASTLFCFLLLGSIVASFFFRVSFSAGSPILGAIAVIIGGATNGTGAFLCSVIRLHRSFVSTILTLAVLDACIVFTTYVFALLFFSSIQPSGIQAILGGLTLFLMIWLPSIPAATLIQARTAKTRGS